MTASSTLAHPARTLPSRGSQRRATLSLPAGWPFVWFFIGYPIWWLLGITVIAEVVAATFMIVHLCRRWDAIVPRHFGWWLLFLAWVAAGALLVQINAPGAVPGLSMTRYFTWGFRLMTFGVATVMLLYLCTFRRELPWQRVSRVLGWMFVYIALGGLLGVIVPFLQFPSPMELLLPGHIAHDPFISSLVHPNLAQVQDYLGVITTRPSAPFPYANSWGLNYACFLPFFLAGWWHHGGRSRRTVSVIVLGVSLIPLVHSLDRAVWGAIAAACIFAAIRGLMRGNARIALACIVLAGVGGAALLVTPLGNTVQARLSGESHNSNEGRANLGTLTATSALQGSPVAGFGTTRDVQGSFRSIAVGSTPSCPGCSGPALGTQGIAWLLIFAFGFGGFALYLGFFTLHFLTSIRSRAPTAMLSAATLLIYLFTSPFYDLSLTSQVAVFAAVAIMAPTVDRPRDSSVTAGSGARYLSEYATLVRHQWRTMLTAALLGVIAGGMWQYARGVPYVGTTTVLIGSDKPGHTNKRPMSLDTAAQLANGPRVQAIIGHTISSSGHDEATSVRVSAVPNTRILKLSYSAQTARDAEQVVTSAATSLLRLRSQALHDDKVSTLKGLDTQIGGLRDSITPLSAGIHALSGSPSVSPLRQQLSTRRSSTYDQIAGLENERASEQAQNSGAGRILQTAQVTHETQRWLVAGVSGGLIGLLLGGLLARLLEAVSPRLRMALARKARRSSLPPVLATISPGDHSLSPASLRCIDGLTCLSADHAMKACAAAERANQFLPQQRPAHPTGVALFATPRCRVRRIKAMERSLLLQEVRVCGLVVVDPGLRNK